MLTLSDLMFPLTTWLLRIITRESRDACYWTMMANKWNDPLFLPTSILMGDLHSDFNLPIMIDHDVVSDMAAATPEKVKDKWSSLIHELKRKIQNWENSGQGDRGQDPFHDNELDFDNAGSRDEPREQPTFGELQNHSRKALDSSAFFFRDKESYLLYLWSVLDFNGLMVTSMQRLDDHIAARNGADGIPSALGGDQLSLSDSFWEEDVSTVTSGGNDNHGSSRKKAKYDSLAKKS
jgi:hypothetical protein